MTRNRKLSICSSRIRDFIGKKRVNKVVSMRNCHPEIRFKMKISGLYSSLFVTIFPRIFEKNGVGGAEKTQNSLLVYSLGFYNAMPLSLLKHYANSHIILAMFLNCTTDHL